MADFRYFFRHKDSEVVLYFINVPSSRYDFIFENLNISGDETKDFVDSIVKLEIPGLFNFVANLINNAAHLRGLLKESGRPMPSGKNLQFTIDWPTFKLIEHKESD